jgi:hypothetical protein
MNSRNSVHFTTLGSLSASSVVPIESMRASDEVLAGRVGPLLRTDDRGAARSQHPFSSTLKEDGAAPNNAQTMLKDSITKDERPRA